MHKVIGITGRKRSGKNTLATALEGVHAHDHGPGHSYSLAFADTMRTALLAADPLVAPDHVQWHCSLSTVIAAYGWEGAKDTVYAESIRGQLQRFGTAMRYVQPDIWVRLLVDRVHAIRAVTDGRPTLIVVTDVRFQNEADAIRRLGGYVVRVQRPGTDQDTHISETGVDAIVPDLPDVLNYGSRSDLEIQAAALYGPALPGRYIPTMRKQTS